MPRHSDVDEPVPARMAAVDAQRVREQLNRILDSEVFRNSRRCQTLLRHVTERALAGEVTALKERTLGSDVFGRDPGYDTNQDTVVRSTAAEVRKKLAQYYLVSARKSELRIALAPGSYLPDFQQPEMPEAATPRRLPRSLIALPIALIVVVAAVALFRLVPHRSPLEQFWGPMLDAQGNVLICLGQPAAYNFRDPSVQSRVDGTLGSSDPLPASLTAADLIRLPDRYVVLGDAICLVRLTSLFDKYSKPFRIRGVVSTSFTDLREQPTVMIGAFNNEWTLRSVGQLRYTFEKHIDGRVVSESVRDRDHPDRTNWKLTNDWPEWNITSDYAIVSRVVDTSIDRTVVTVAGITQFGTMGAGEFLTNPAYFAQALPRLPRGWQNRNLQIVLSIPVVRGAPAHPHVLATHVW